MKTTLVKRLISLFKPIYYIDHEHMKPARPMEVLLINEDTDQFSEALGIDPERMCELSKSVVSAYDSYPNTMKAISKVSTMCVHPNELAFCAYSLRALHDYRKQMV